MLYKFLQLHPGAYYSYKVNALLASDQAATFHSPSKQRPQSAMFGFSGSISNLQSQIQLKRGTKREETAHQWLQASPVKPSFVTPKKRPLTRQAVTEVKA